MTYLCVSIMVESVEQALADAALAAERGADLVEYRIDHLAERGGAEVEMPGLSERSPLPHIVTCRAEWEGGDFHGDEESRLALLRSLVEFGGSPYVDVELKTIERDQELALEAVDGRNDHEVGPTKLIYSSHDFETRPADLTRRLNAMNDDPACRVAKLAWRARSLRDNIEAFELLAERSKPMIALCMGEAGLPSRVLAKKFGGFLTFVGLNDQSVTAPGQVGVETIKSLYRWDAIDADSRVYGVIGHPVGHSISPAIMNGGFDAVDYNGVYLPMPIPPEYEHFKATVGSWLDYKPLDFRGASVTIPHKANLIRFVRERGGEVEELADRIGAANTLVVRDDGSLFACNTDYAALMDSVCAARSIERDGLAGSRVAILGAGGAARAAVAGFAAHGCDVTVYNRTAAKAHALVEQLAQTHPVADGTGGAIRGASLEQFTDDMCDILINCTPVGMHPDVDATPVVLGDDAQGIVFDTIYNPIQTRLLREAEALGCVTISGVEMFVRQAARQFELWTGEPAPTGLFDRIVRKRLGA